MKFTRFFSRSDLQVFIHCSNAGMKVELESLLGDETLKKAPERSNGVDDLRFVLMISKVSISVNSDALSEVPGRLDAAIRPIIARGLSAVMVV